MTKDYKNTPKPGADKGRAKARPKPTASKGAATPMPGWVWLLAGLAIGLFVALLVYLKDFSADTAPAGVVERDPAAAAQKAEAAARRQAEERRASERKAEEAAEAQKPRFDFYDLLPEMEVLIPDQELAAEREKTPAEKVVYYLQAASFRKYEEADRMRAQLALLNIESEVQRVIVNDNNAWHRVRIGPFKSARAMDKVRGRLRANDIDPIVIKVKQ